MFDTRATVAALGPGALIAVDVWSNRDAAAARLGVVVGGSLPNLLESTDLAGGWRALRVEPTVWWLAGPLGELGGRLGAIEAALGEDGGAVDLTGGLARLEVAGLGWRALLMFGGVFDAEDLAFGPGVTVGTMLYHVDVRYDVVDDGRVHILVAPSYARDLLAHLRAAAARLEPADSPSR